MTQLDRDWEACYQTGDLPWDSERPSRELIDSLPELNLTGGRVLELGCGTGTNALYLAQQGFNVTAIDISRTALDRADQRADAAKVHVNFVRADVQDFGDHMEPFDFVFDRGCYHCCRRVDLAGYLDTVKLLTHAGSRMLCLCGNANEAEADGGPPRVTEEEVRTEFAPLFEIDRVREFHFEDVGGAQGPLAWSVLMTRRAETE